MPRLPLTPDVIFIRARAGTKARVDALRPAGMTQADWYRKLLISAVNAEEKRQRKGAAKAQRELEEMMREEMYPDDDPGDDDAI